jgi:hypothetical protein
MAIAGLVLGILGSVTGLLPFLVPGILATNLLYRQGGNARRTASPLAPGMTRIVKAFRNFHQRGVGFLPES